MDLNFADTFVNSSDQSSFDHMTHSKLLSERQNPNKFPRSLKHKFVLSPISRSRVRWDVITLFMLGYVSLVSTFEIGFLGPEWAEKKGSNFWFLFVVNRLVDIFFLADLFVTSITGYYDEPAGTWINSNCGIFVHYLRGWFLIDFTSCIPFDLISMAADAEVMNLKLMRLLRLLRIAKLLRLLRASRIIKRLHSKVVISYRVQTYIAGFLKVALFGHWGACAFHLLAMIQEEDGSNSWLNMQPLDLTGPDGSSLLGRLQQNRMNGKGMVSQYITSLHWCIGALKAEDTFSTTPAERFLGLFIMITGAALWANLASAVVITELSLNSSDIEYKRSMDNLLIFCKQHFIPPHVVQLLREYFMRCRSMYSTNYRQEVLMQLSPSLRGLVALHCNTGWIMKVPYLRPHATEAANYLTDMSLHLQNTAFPAGENIVLFNEPNSRMFVIKFGVVCSSRGHISTNGSYFGEDMVTSLVTPLMSRTYTTMALSFCECYFLTSQDLNQILNGIRYPKTRRQCRISAFKLRFCMQFTAWINETKKQMDLQGNRQIQTVGNKTKLFLSYGRGKATEFTKWAKKELTARGFEVWMDDQIESGEDWEKAIGDALLSCDGIVSVIDRKYKISTFCKDEISLAKSEGKAIFPILFRDFSFADLPAYLKFILASVNVVKFEKQQQDVECIEALCKSIEMQFSREKGNASRHLHKSVSMGLVTDPSPASKAKRLPDIHKAASLTALPNVKKAPEGASGKQKINRSASAAPYPNEGHDIASTATVVNFAVPNSSDGAQVGPSPEVPLKDTQAQSKNQLGPIQEPAGYHRRRSLGDCDEPVKDVKQVAAHHSGRRKSTTGTAQSLRMLPHFNFPENAAFWRSANNSNVRKLGKASRYAETDSAFKQQLAMAAPRHVQLPGSASAGGVLGGGGGGGDGHVDTAELEALHTDLDTRLASIEQKSLEQSLEMGERIETLESALVETQQDIEGKIAETQRSLMVRLDQIVGMLGQAGTAPAPTSQ
jgi:potassium voltage-gated channel Eag-related subfamily H protein 7